MYIRHSLHSWVLGTQSRPASTEGRQRLYQLDVEAEGPDVPKFIYKPLNTLAVVSWKGAAQPLLKLKPPAVA